MTGRTNGKSNYWLGKRPWNGHRWVYTEAAEVLESPQYKEAVFHMHRRYIKQWNDIELDQARCLSEHTHRVHGAQVVGSHRRFILHAEESDMHWILEVLFDRRFSEFHRGLSFGKNAMRCADDIHSLHLHWRGAGRERFEAWLEEERAAAVQTRGAQLCPA